MTYFFSEINVANSIITILGVQDLYGTSKIKTELNRGKEIANQARNYLNKKIGDSKDIQSISLTYANSLNFKAATMLLGSDLQDNREQYIDYVRARVIGRYIEHVKFNGFSEEDEEAIESDLNIDFKEFTKKVFSKSFTYQMTIWDYIESMFSYFELLQYFMRNSLSPQRLSDNLRFDIAWKINLPTLAILLFSDVKNTITAQPLDSDVVSECIYTPIGKISLIDALPNYSPLKYIEEAVDKLIDNDGNFSLVQRHWVIEILDDLESSTLQEEFNSFKENRLNKLNSKSPVSMATIVTDFKVLLSKLKHDKNKYLDNEYNTLVASLNKACACMWAVMILQRLFYYFKSYLNVNGKVDFFKQIKSYIVSAKSVSQVNSLLNNDAIVFNEIYQNLLNWNPDNYNQIETYYIENDDLKYILPIFELKKLFHLTNLNSYGSHHILRQEGGLSMPLYRKTVTKEQLQGVKIATWLNMDYFYTTEKMLHLLENNKSEPQFEPIFYFYKCLEALRKNQLEPAREYINKSFESLNKNFDNICIGIYISYIVGFYIGLLKSIKYNQISKYATYLIPNDFTHNHLIGSLIDKGIHKKEITWSILFASVRLFNYFSYRNKNPKELIFNPFKAMLNALGPLFVEINKSLDGANNLDESQINYLLKKFIPNKSAILKLKINYLDVNIINFIKNIHYYLNLYNELGLYELNPNEPLVNYLCNPVVDSQCTIPILLNYLESK